MAGRTSTLRLGVALLASAAAVLLALARGCWSLLPPARLEGSPRPGPEPQTLQLAARLGGDAADLYLPADRIHQRPLPLVLLLSGANVDKSHYSTFAALLALEGFLVVVPNHWRTFPPIPLLGRRMLLADQRQISATIAGLRQLASTEPSLKNRMALDRVVVIGHSMGGLAGLEALADRCRFPLCVGFYRRPADLRAGLFVGTDLAGHGGGPVAPIVTGGRPVALVRGSRDGASTATDAEATWVQLRTSHRARLTLEGANHYAITNTSRPTNPAGLPVPHPDPNPASADQRQTLERLAIWSARFLHAALLLTPSP